MTEYGTALSFNTPTYMRYQKPDAMLEEGPDKFQIVRSQQGNTVFRENNIVKIHLSSTDSFLRPNKCFVTYKVQFTKSGVPITAATNASMISTSWAGVPAGTIFRVRTSCVGQEIEDVPHYSAYLGAVYGKLPAEAQNTLAVLEGTGQQTDLYYNYLGTGRYYAHAPKTAVFESSRLLPIPFMRSLDVEFQLSTLDQLVALTTTDASSKADGFIVDDFAFHACWVPVDKGYLADFYTGLMEHGKQAFIPLKLASVVPSTFQTALGALADLSTRPARFCEFCDVCRARWARISQQNLLLQAHTQTQL